MIERDKNQEYKIQQEEAAIIIRPSGDIEVLMPMNDADENSQISSDSPTFKAMVIIAFLNNKELRDQVADRLIAEHFIQ